MGLGARGDLPSNFSAAPFELFSGAGQLFFSAAGVAEWSAVRLAGCRGRAHPDCKACEACSFARSHLPLPPLARCGRRRQGWVRNDFVTVTVSASIKAPLTANVSKVQGRYLSQLATRAPDTTLDPYL